MHRTTLAMVMAVVALLAGARGGWCQEGGAEGGLDTQSLSGLLGNLGALGMMGGLAGGGQGGGNVTVIIQQPVALVYDGALVVLYQGHITKYDCRTLQKLQEATYPTEPAPQRTVFGPSAPPKIIRAPEASPAAAPQPQH